MKLHFELKKALDLQYKDFLKITNYLKISYSLISDYSLIAEPDKKLIAGSLIHCCDIYSGTKQTSVSFE